MVKSLSMGTYDILVLSKSGKVAWSGGVPEPVTMGVIAFLALPANLAVAGLLYTFRDGDANMRSVWLCWEFNLRFKTDSSGEGPQSGKPFIVAAGMSGDRAFVVFAGPEEITAFIKRQCN